MGGKTSTQLSQSLDSSSLNQMVSNIITTNESNVSNVINMDNTITLKNINGGIFDCGEYGINLVQKNNGNMKAVTAVTNQTAAELKGDLSASIQATGEQTNKLLQGFLAGIGQENNTSMNNKISTSIQNVINNNVTTNNINRIMNQINAKNSQEIVNDGGIIKGKGCQFYQENIADLQANTILQNLLNAVVENKMVSDTVAKATQVNDIQQKGLDDLMGAMLWPIAIIVVAVVLGMSYFGGEVVKTPIWGKVVLALVLAGIAALIGYLLYVYITGGKDISFSVDRWIPKKNAEGFNTGECEKKNFGSLDEVVTSNQTYETEEKCKPAARTYWRCPVDSYGRNIPGNPVQCVDGFDSSNPDAKRLGIMCEGKSASEVRASGNCQYAYVCEQGRCNRINSQAINKNLDKYGMSTVSEQEALQICTTKCT